MLLPQEEDPEKKLEETLKDLLSDLQLQGELLHSSVDVRLKLEPLGHTESFLIEDVLAAMDVP